MGSEMCIRDRYITLGPENRQNTPTPTKKRKGIFRDLSAGEQANEGSVLTDERITTGVLAECFLVLLLTRLNTLPDSLCAFFALFAKFRDHLK